MIFPYTAKNSDRWDKEKNSYFIQFVEMKQSRFFILEQISKFFDATKSSRNKSRNGA